MSPRPSTAVPSVTTATVFCLIVSARTLSGSSVDRHAHAGDARRVGHREVVAGLHRHLVVHLDLAAQVHQEGAVGDVARSRRRGPPRTASTIRWPWSASGGRDGDVAHACTALVTRTRSIAPTSPSASAIAAATRANEPGAGRELDAHRQAVGGRGIDGTARSVSAAERVSARASDTLSFPMATVKQKAQPKDINLDDAPGPAAATSSWSTATGSPTAPSTRCRRSCRRSTGSPPTRCWAWPTC